MIELFSLSPRFCAYNKVLILEQNDQNVIIGMCNIDDLELKKRIEKSFKNDWETRNLLFEHISETTWTQISAKENIQLYGIKEDELDSNIQKPTKESDELINDISDDYVTPTVEFLDGLLVEGMASHASDIHIEMTSDLYATIKLRIDGILQNHTTITKDLFSGIIRRIKVLSKLESTDTRKAQDGRFSYFIDNEEIDIRVSCVPCVYGESVVLRLLALGRKPYALDEIGFLTDQLNIVQKMINQKSKLVLVCGPTGAGKTTTLATLLTTVSTVGKKIITIEDPVEYRLNGITQIEVNTSMNMDFSDILRRVLRHDPDVIMIGEIRDEKTAKTTIRAAITGHLVFATVHTTDAASAILRLIELGISPFLLSSVFGGAIAQYLLPKTGGGRVLISEVLEANTVIQEQILRQSSVQEIKHSMHACGMEQLEEVFIKKKKLGLINTGVCNENYL